MSGQENNYKYIAEAWFNDEEKEYEFKRAFLENLVEQYQGHNNGFDADKLDGMHYADILEVISTSTTDMMTTFYIGDTHFEQKSTGGEKYYIDLKGIKLYPESNHIDEGTFINVSEYPWNYTVDYYRDKPTSRERLGGNSNADVDDDDYWPNPTLFDIIREAYYLLHTNKVSVNVFNSLRDRVTTLESNVGNMENHHLNGKLNADTVNGLQFYVVTQEQYENDYTASQKNDIHNVFIIKDSIPGGTYDGNPSFPSFLNDGYEFAIERMRIPNPNDPNTFEEKLCLVYRIKSNNNQPNEWKVIAPAADFIDEDYLAEIIESNSFQLSMEVMREGYKLEVPIHSLREYEENNANTHNDSLYIIPKYVKKNYLYGARAHTLEYISPSNLNSSGRFNVVKVEGTDDIDYKYIDNVSNSSTGDIIKHNNYLYLNLDSTIKNIKDVVHSRFGVVDGYINDIRASISDILGNIQTINNTQNVHANRISATENDIGDLKTKLSGKASMEWSTYELTGIDIWTKQYSKNGGTKYPFNNDAAKNYIKYNLDLGLAYIELHFVHRTSVYFQGNWRGLTIPKSYDDGNSPITVEQGGSYSATYGDEIPRGTGMWDIYTTYELKQNLAYQQTFENNSDIVDPFISQSVPTINYPAPLSHNPIVSEQDYQTAGSPYIPRFLLPRHDVMLTPINDVNCDRNWAKVKISSTPRKLHFNPGSMDEIFNSNDAESGNYYVRHSPGEIMVWYNQNLATSGDYRARDITIHASGLYKIKGTHDGD